MATASVGLPATDEAPFVFRFPLWMRLFSVGGTLILAVVAAGFLGFAFLLLIGAKIGLGMLVLGLGNFMAGLAGYAGRDLRGRLWLRVEVGPQRLVLDLPGGRSLIHRPPSQHLSFAYPEIAAIETRLEGYEGIGGTLVNRTFVLVPRQGELVFLFEDRALATGFVSRFFSPLAERIAAKAGVPVRNLGMVAGKGGVLAVWGTHAPDWSAPSLPPAQQLRIWRHAAMTGLLAGTGTMLGGILYALIQLLKS